MSVMHGGQVMEGPALMEEGGGRAFPRGLEVASVGQDSDTRCQGREERQICSPPRVAAGMGRESPGAELGVPSIGI